MKRQTLTSGPPSREEWKPADTIFYAPFTSSLTSLARPQARGNGVQRCRLRSSPTQGGGFLASCRYPGTRTGDVESLSNALTNQCCRREAPVTPFDQGSGERVALKSAFGPVCRRLHPSEKNTFVHLHHGELVMDSPTSNLPRSPRQPCTWLLSNEQIRSLTAENWQVAQSRGLMARSRRPVLWHE